MNDEEFIQALKEWGVDTNFKTPKDKLYYMYCIASIYNKKIEIIKVSKRKCYTNFTKAKRINISYTDSTKQKLYPSVL